MIGACRRIVKTARRARSSRRQQTQLSPKQIRAAQRGFTSTLAKDLFDSGVDQVYVARRTGRVCYIGVDGAVFAIHTAEHPASSEIVQTIGTDIENIGTCQLPRAAEQMWGPPAATIDFRVQFEFVLSERNMAARQLARVLRFQFFGGPRPRSARLSVSQFGDDLKLRTRAALDLGRRLRVFDAGRAT